MENLYSLTVRIGVPAENSRGTKSLRCDIKVRLFQDAVVDKVDLVTWDLKMVDLSPTGIT